MTERSSEEKLLSPNQEHIWEAVNNFVGISLSILESSIQDKEQLGAAKRLMQREVYRFRTELCNKIT